MKSHRIIVCGGREYLDMDRVNEVMDRLLAKYPDLHIIHGAATGADTLAELWAKKSEVPYTGIPARWSKLGNYAGPYRNRLMAELSPMGGVAFPGGKGTADMVNVLREKNVRVWEIDQ